MNKADRQLIIGGRLYFLIMHYALCIMHYALCIIHYVLEMPRLYIVPLRLVFDVVEVAEVAFGG